MIKIENYPNAYKEVYVILQNMEEQEVKAIPNNFMNMIKMKMNNDYDFTIDNSVDFDEQKIMQETKAILAYIFLNYWATKEQKDRITKKFKQDIINEELSKDSYNPDEIFKNKKPKQFIENEKIENDNQLIEYKKENIFIRLFNKIKSLFSWK